jgi:tryptophan-rich hypothetical protein
MTNMALSPKKLLCSKWTATTPQNREMHFIVVRVTQDETDPQIVTEVTLEAVLSKRHQTLHWRDLSDETRWKAGWL